MLGGLRGGSGDASVDQALPDRQWESRCRLHEFDLVPQGAVRDEYHLVWHCCIEDQPIRLPPFAARTRQTTFSIACFEPFLLGSPKEGASTSRSLTNLGISAVRFSAGWVTRPASASAEVQLEPDHPPVRASQGAPPTGQRVHQFQPAAAERLQVVRSALRGGARTGVIDLDPQPIVAELIAHLNVPPEAPEAVWQTALVVTR